jgi:hypothetical protein
MSSVNFFALRMKGSLSHPRLAQGYLTVDFPGLLDITTSRLVTTTAFIALWHLSTTITRSLIVTCRIPSLTGAHTTSWYLGRESNFKRTAWKWTPTAMPSSTAPEIVQMEPLHRRGQGAQGQGHLLSMRRSHFHLSPRLFPSTQVRLFHPKSTTTPYTKHLNTRYYSNTLNWASVFSFVILDNCGA